MKYTKEEYIQYIKDNSQDNAYKLTNLDGNDDNLRLETSYALGEINFVEYGEIIIVEMKITNLKDDDIKFYLHFELLEESRAKELFNEMKTTLIDLKDQQITKVLLCCSSALTSSYFANLLNESAEFLKKDFTFDYTSLDQLYEVGVNYDIILFAPQIKYALPEAKEILSEQYVTDIPTKIFAAYDTSALIEMLRSKKAYHNEKIVEKEKIKIKKELINKARVISVLVNYHHKTPELEVRYYEGNKLIIEDTLKKKDFGISDVKEILMAYQIKNMNEIADYLVVSLPGSINSEGAVRIIDGKKGMQVFDIKNNLEEKLHIKTIVINSTESAALGCYYAQDKYKSINYYSQQKHGGCGISIIYEGKLIRGRNDIIGELTYATEILKHGKDAKHDSNSPKAAIKQMADHLVNNIVHTGPDVIYINCQMTPNMQAVKERLEKYLPEEYIPELIYVSEADRIEYIHFGNLLNARNELEK